MLQSSSESEDDPFEKYRCLLNKLTEGLYKEGTTTGLLIIKHHWRRLLKLGMISAVKLL